MRKTLLLLVISLALFAASGWAFRHGANYELRDFSDSARISVLDTTLIGEKWEVIAAGLAMLALLPLCLAALRFLKVRNEFR
jgi:hypothetical protein